MQSKFPANLRRRGDLIRRNDGISWNLSGDSQEGYLGVLLSYAGRYRLRWVKKSEYEDKVRYPSVVPLYMEL